MSPALWQGAAPATRSTVWALEAAMRIRVRAEETQADGVRDVPHVKKNSSKRACRPAGI